MLMALLRQHSGIYKLILSENKILIYIYTFKYTFIYVYIYIYILKIYLASLAPPKQNLKLRPWGCGWVFLHQAGAD